MAALPTHLRKRLEKAIIEARAVAEQGARKALEALAVGRHEPHGSMSSDERTLRKRLRAHSRQLGDIKDNQKGTQSIRRLEREVAYEHWHRMLFARFLAENHLLIEPRSKVAVTLEDCEELAREANVDPWALAASFAQGMLPQIFRPDDPALALGLPPETRQALQKLLADLEPEVFTADDALGWTYQFWQAAEKEAVNARVKSGEKITGETLPAVTQLFTEPYMVQFLLHNTIGAWHAGKVIAARPDLTMTATSEQELRDAVALDEYQFAYLRFVREPREGDADGTPSGPWRPAAGTYAGWPNAASELKVLDPCCGSGHFLVAAFDLLVSLRRAERGLTIDEAIQAVIADNLFGLELDARCTQIAAFHLALAAWRRVGKHIELPSMHIACSGIGPNASKAEWLELAEQAAASAGMPVKRDLFGKEESLLSDALRTRLEQLHETFQLAPELGSLIDPSGQASDLYVASFDQIEPLLDAVLKVEAVSDEVHERAVAAQGMAKAARILVGPPAGYTLVLTNVPYLGRGSQSELLKAFAEEHYNEAKSDLATVFVARMFRWIESGKGGGSGGTVAAVTPQNWLFLTSYRKLRERLLTQHSWEIVARLGPGAFETIGGQVVNVALLAISGARPSTGHLIAGVEVSTASPASAKAALLRGECGDGKLPHDTLELAGNTADEEADNPPVGTVRPLLQAQQVENPDARLVLTLGCSAAPLRAIAGGWQGIASSDFPRFGRCFWELPEVAAGWRFQQSTVRSITLYGAREHVLFWEDGFGSLTEVCQEGAAFRGKEAWGKDGIAVAQMGDLPVTIYTGELLDNNTAAITPNDPRSLPAIWAYCSSPEFAKAVRRIDQALKVTNASLVKVPFDFADWQKVATEMYPNGLPEPQSDDPTQWLFHSHPAYAESYATLQVALARLVGYRWPAELDEHMRLAPEARGLVRRSFALTDLADDDGIVCLTSIKGEGSAADRLRSLLAQAFGAAWSATKERDLLRAAGERFRTGKAQRSLEEWLRDQFFEEHCALFHNRPFVWHIWDGHQSGFHALLNYHRLAGADGAGRRALEKLTSTYLGEWIERQRQFSAAGEEGADGRLAAATSLQAELRKILAGEPPYDLFVRWKPLNKQPIGWEPDINDGVRLNIRPFLMAKDVGAKNAGVLRARPDNTWSNPKKLGVKDRGQEPESLRPRHLFPWFWGCDPEQHPEHRTDFGAGTAGSTPAAREFTGSRWNGLHYTRAAKQAARARQEEGA